MEEYAIDGHKLYWHMDRVLEWQKDRNIPPIYMEVSPVSCCNHRCIFCGVDFAMERAVQLDGDVYLAQLPGMARAGVRSIMYAGEGEPLLHRDIVRFITETRRCGIDAALTTNGTLGTGDLWDATLPALSWVKFSVDAGTPEVYRRVHRVGKKTFDTTLESIGSAVAVKRTKGLDVTLGVQFIVMEENFDDIARAVALFSSMGVDYLVLKPYSLHPQMKRKREVFYTPERVEQVQRIVDGYGSPGGMALIFRRASLEKYARREKVFHHCRALPFWGYISSCGDFYTCSVYLNDERFRVANIRDVAFEKMMAGARRKESIRYGETELVVDECRVNCRMARVNEFLEFLENRPGHINFI